MRLPLKARQWLRREVALRTEARRPPDMVIGDDPDWPYLRRWYVIPRNKYFNIYFHNFCRSDDDRALHTHPWTWNLSIILLGSYMEETPLVASDPSGPRKRRDYAEGSIIYRGSGTAPHRVLLHPEVLDTVEGGDIMGEQDCWTLFITGRNVRGWGFWCPGGRYVPWQKFTAPSAGGKSGAIGAGCGED